MAMTIDWNSSTLWALCVARTICCRHPLYCSRERGGLQVAQVGAAGDTEIEQSVELALVERRTLGGALHLDEQAAAGHHDVHVGLGAHVFDVGEVEHRLAVDDADRHGRDGVEQRRRLLRDELLRPAPLDRVGERDVRAGDRRRARAAVGLQHVAVDHDRVLAERLGVDDRAQGAADEPGDLVRASADLALHALAVVAAVGRARQHRVLGRDPALALAGEPARHAVRERRGAQHLRAAERDERRAFGVAAPAALDRDGAQLVDGAPVGADGRGGGVGHSGPHVRDVSGTTRLRVREMVVPAASGSFLSDMRLPQRGAGRSIAPVCTSCTSVTSRPISRCASRRNSSAEAPVAS